MMNDQQLLAQAKQLDPAALHVLHQRFYEPVARYIQFKVGDPYTVEDLSGEVFVRVLKQPASVSGSARFTPRADYGIAHQAVVA